MEKKKVRTIDEYIAAFPEDIQTILSKIRATIHAAAPKAQETIKYDMPTFTLQGNLIYFAAFKKHIGLFPITQEIKNKVPEMAGFQGTKDSARLPLDQPIPYGMIRRIVAVRVKEDLAYHKAKAAKTTNPIYRKRTSMEKKKTPETVDEFIAGYPPEIQAILQKIRATVRKAAPKATEILSYGVPTFKMERNLVSFAAAKKHIGFYPTPAAIELFKAELAPYISSKGAVQFPLDKPIPYALIGKMTKARVKQEAGRAGEKAKPKPKSSK